MAKNETFMLSRTRCRPAWRVRNFANTVMHRGAFAFVVAAAAAGGAPRSDVACSLNGAIDSTNGCVCRPAWRGPHCGELVLQPATKAFQMPGMVAWGAAPIQDPACRWHM